jgi:hypothetical protein
MFIRLGGSILISLQMPDTHSEQVQWIESLILTDRFDRMVDERIAVGVTSSGIQLTDQECELVAQRGLQSLSPQRFALLLNDHAALIELRGWVLEHGSDYWTRLADRRDDDTQRISKILQAVKSDHEFAASKKVGLAESRRVSNSVWVERSFVAAISAAATAAMLLVMFQTFDGRPSTIDSQTSVAQGPVSTTTPPPLTAARSAPASALATSTNVWGFEKFAKQINQSNDRLDPPLDRESYLEQLAVAAEAWTVKRPENSADLARRIGEFRMGCSALLLASHEPLPQADRDWLREKCANWAAALDRHLQEVESGVDSNTVRRQVDQTVIKIAAALRGRSSSI